MGSSDTLSWFIQLFQSHFPAENYFLSMWDHNWGWHAGYLEQDETSNDQTIEYPDISRSLSEVTPSLEPISLLGYDACVSSQIEVLHTWRPFAHNFAGSQDYVGWGGIDYAAVLSAINSNSSISAADLSQVVAESMLTDPDDTCSSAFKLNEGFDELVVAVDKLSKELIRNISQVRSRLSNIRRDVPQTPDYVYDDFHRDLLAMADSISKEFSDFPEIVSAAADVVTAFSKSVSYNRVDSSHGASCTGGNGLSIYWPKSGQGPSADYLTTSFAKSTNWDDFLQLF